MSKTSVSDYMEYKQASLDAASNDEAFNNFKTNRYYTTILEHASYEQGLGYIDYINNTKFDFSKLPLLKTNDLQGNAQLKDYQEPYGQITPSTLRYIKVLVELEEMFGSLEGMDIVEIGTGYGGQCKIINDYFKLKSYTLVDLPEILTLNKRYLSKFNYKNIVYRTQEELTGNKKYDLLISNYAFSECERSVQNDYIEKILKNSSRGYITYNNISEIFNVDSINGVEFAKVFPCLEKAEVPLTGANSIYYWQ